MLNRRIFLNAVVPTIAIAQQPPRDEKTRALIEKMGMSEGSLKEGDAAPDFDLTVLKQNTRVKLSAFAGKRPVALLFGSYS